MRLAILSVALTAAALSACATSPRPPAPVADAAAPAPIDGYDWFMHQDGGEAMLAYGVADSDEVKLRFDCGKGTGRLHLIAPAVKGERQFHLESGGDTERYPASLEPSGLHDGDLMNGEAPADAPVFQRFRRLGWIAAWRGQDREVYAAHPGSEDKVEAFFSVCG